MTQPLQPITVNVFADGCSPDGGVTLAEIKELLVTNQEKLTALATAVDGFATEIMTAVTGIASDIQAIKDANPAVDFTAADATLARLQTATASLKALDAEHPPAPPVA